MAGSRWEQTLVFPAGKRYFLSSDKVTVANDGEAPFLRIDMPGHIIHKKGDTLQRGLPQLPREDPRRRVPQDFAPDEKFLYVRKDGDTPRRFIRAYHLRDPKTGQAGPWLAGMTLDPASVSEAWCHQRGYVCMIEEIGGRPIKAGQTFGAAFMVGFFDSIEEMERTYDQYLGHDALEVELERAGSSRTRSGPDRGVPPRSLLLADRLAGEQGVDLLGEDLALGQADVDGPDDPLGSIRTTNGIASTP